MKNVRHTSGFTNLILPSNGTSDAIVKMKTWMQYKRYDLRSICEHCNAATYFMQTMQISSPEKINENMLMIFETKEIIQQGPYHRVRKQLWEALKMLLHANDCSEEVITEHLRHKKRKRAMAA